MDYTGTRVRCGLHWHYGSVWITLPLGFAGDYTGTRARCGLNYSRCSKFYGGGEKLTIRYKIATVILQFTLTWGIRMQPMFALVRVVR